MKVHMANLECPLIVKELIVEWFRWSNLILKWLDHMERMGENELTKRIMD